MRRGVALTHVSFGKCRVSKRPWCCDSVERWEGEVEGDWRRSRAVDRVVLSRRFSKEATAGRRRVLVTLVVGPAASDRGERGPWLPASPEETYFSLSPLHHDFSVAVGHQWSVPIPTRPPSRHSPQSQHQVWEATQNEQEITPIRRSTCMPRLRSCIGGGRDGPGLNATKTPPRIFSCIVRFFRSH